MHATGGWTEFYREALLQAHDLAKEALGLEESDAGAHALLGMLHLYQGDYDLAINELRRVIELNPNSPSGYHMLGWGLLYSNRTDEAIKALETALRLDPNRESS